MSTSVLDKPVDLGLEDFSVACALHEIIDGKPPCDREATLVVKAHSCFTTVSCAQCWTQLLDYMEKSKPPGVVGANSHYKCMSCGKTGKKVEDLIWSEKL